MKLKFFKLIVKYGVFVALLLFFVLSFTAKAYALSSSELLVLVNQSRNSEGLSSLTPNPQLVVAAHNKAMDMLEKDYFAHVSPQGKTPWDFIKSSGYVYTYAGENLAIGFSGAKELHEAWMNSPSHRENIMNPNYREIGIAVEQGNYEGTNTSVAVQMFGKSGIIESQVMSSSIDESRKVEVIKEKTGFEPIRIFAEESINLKVTLKGEPDRVIVFVGNEEANLLSTGQIRQESNEMIIQKVIKVKQPGEVPVQITVFDKNGNDQSFSLGKVMVVKNNISKDIGSSSIELYESYWKLGLLGIGLMLMFFLLPILIKHFRKTL